MMDGARAVLLLLEVVGLVAWSLVLWRCEVRERGRAVLWLTMLTNALAFTIVAAARLLPPDVLNIWSSIVRAHTMIAVIVVAVDDLTDGDCNA